MAPGEGSAPFRSRAGRRPHRPRETTLHTPIRHHVRTRTLTVAAAAAVACIATVLVPAIGRADAASGWDLCIFRGSMRPDYVATHERWIGRRMDAVLEYIPYSSWSAIARPVNQIKAWSSTPYDVVFTTPMLPNDGSTLAAGARGAYDAHWRTFARTFIDQGRPDARIRLGHELNHTYYPWRATGGLEAPYAAYYRRIVQVTRAAGAKFRFTWNLLSPGSRIDITKAYPGDAYVSVISLDLYDGVYGVTDFEKRWQVLKTQRYGLDWVRAFAAAHGKPVAFDEWALRFSTNHQYQDPKTNSGDNTVYIDRMIDWFGANRVAYGCYFDWRTSSGWSDSRILNGQYPNASATWRRRVGTSTTSTTSSTTATTSTAGSTTDVALIVSNAASPAANDVPLRNRLVALGKRVRLVDDDSVTSTSLSGARSIVVSSSVVPSKVPTWLAGHAAPILNLEVYAQGRLRTASNARETSGQTTLRIVDTGHSLAAGRSGDVAVQSSAPLASSTPASGARVVAKSAAGVPSVYGIEKGAPLTSGTAPARRVGFFLSYDSPPRLSSHGWAMFDAAVRWLG